MTKNYFTDNVGKNIMTSYCVLMTVVVIIMSFILWNRPQSECTCNVPERQPREVVINDMSSSSIDSE